MTHTQPGMRSVSVYVLLEVMSKQGILSFNVDDLLCKKDTERWSRPRVCFDSGTTHRREKEDPCDDGSHFPLSSTSHLLSPALAFLSSLKC